jgi:hypothetical protein
MRDFSLVRFSIYKVYLILSFLLFYSCKEKKTDKIIVQSIEQLNPITDSKLNQKINDFINKNTLDKKYKQIYLIFFNLKDKDTLLIINKTFMPKIVDKNLEYKGGFYFNNAPVLIIDLINPIGVDYYNYKYLNDSIIRKYDSIEHPTSFRKLMKTEKYLIKDGNWEKHI